MNVDDVTLRNTTQDAEDISASSFRPSFLHAVETLYNNMNNGKKWLMLLTVLILAVAYLVSESFNGPFFGAKHGLLPVRFTLRNIVANDMTAASGKPDAVVIDNSLRQRLDIVEAQLLKLTHEIPESEDRYKVDYFDPRNKAVTWLKYTSPEKMRKVGGWMGIFKKQVPFRYVFSE